MTLKERDVKVRFADRNSLTVTGGDKNICFGDREAGIGLEVGFTGWASAFQLG